MSYLVFDLETIPDVAGLRNLHQWGDEFTDAQVVEQAQALQIEKNGSDFMPLYLQKIVAIGCVFVDHLKGFQVRCLGSLDDTEETLIKQFFKTIDYYAPQLISWNGSGFDLPVLHYRSLIYGVTASRYWDQGEDDRDFKYNNYINRYHNRHLDLMDLLAKYNARANAPLDQLAKLCGFPGKLGMDGSQVWAAYQAGQLDQVRAYCETDVVNTWLMYCRFRLLKGELDQASYEQEIQNVRTGLMQNEQPHWQAYLQAWDGV